ncbi:MAG: hypothetical protein KKE55_05965 [Candidatus Omnitrophica bacterium]|nr:hypothetical protein [Candidatus Omnitrophota bacterium]MBU1524271.1 hypothetical protein [Candidatus Omnitrophota bacterium]MBU2437222.1 hypothetical protein [Candidatus Omnitrophota bacterium]
MLKKKKTNEVETVRKLAVFKGKQIRRLIYNDEWWFSVVDIVEALTDSPDPKQYIKRVRQRDPELNSYWGTICTPLELLAKDGKKREVISNKVFPLWF